MTEKNQVMSFEALLEGTPLSAFLMELIAIADEDLIEKNEVVIQGDEVNLGKMTLFEKRLSVWCDQRKEQLNQDVKAFYGNIDLLESQSKADTMKALDEFAARSEEIEERRKLLSDTIRGRFPDAEGLVIRAGSIIANAKRNQVRIGISIMPGMAILGGLGAFDSLSACSRRGGCTCS